MAEGTLQNWRMKCPKCGRKGVGFAGHPHAFGWKDYSRARCRYCRAEFKVRNPTDCAMDCPDPRPWTDAAKSPPTQDSK